MGHPPLATAELPDSWLYFPPERTLIANWSCRCGRGNSDRKNEKTSRAAPGAGRLCDRAAQIVRGKDFIQLKNGPFDLDLIYAPDGIERFDDAWKKRIEIEGFHVCHIDDIIAKKPKSVWFQLGIRNDEAAERLARAGIDVVQDRCLLVELRRLGR